MAAVEAAIEQIDLAFLFDEIPKTITQSMDGINRVGAIVRAMKEFSHPGTEEKAQVDINQALENTLTVSRNEWKYIAEVKTDFAPDLPLPFCLPGEINQVFLNIIVNAAHAISDVTDGGKKGLGRIGVSTQVRDNSLEIRITDTGGGIPETVQHRIFDPFFTTKKIGKGTGQGLAIARNVVVDKHQGKLRFETEEGKGTTFIIQLPLQ
jgi:signal transduction histidine kinase